MGFGETYQVSHSHYRGPLLLGGMDAEAPFQCGNHLYGITVWSNAKVPIQCQGVPNSEAWAEGDLLEQGINGECRVKSKHSGLRNGSPEPDGEIGCPQDSSLLQRRPGSEQGVEASPPTGQAGGTVVRSIFREPSGSQPRLLGHLGQWPLARVG